MSNQAENSQEQPTKTEQAIHLLVAQVPANRGEAFATLKNADLTGSGQFFNAVMSGYTDKTGITLQKSDRAVQREDNKAALQWAHNAPVSEVAKICTQSNGQGAHFWSAWKLHKEGKWPELGTQETFTQYFDSTKRKSVEPEVLLKAVIKLSDGKARTRGDAFNLLKDEQGKVDKNLYALAVQQYEEQTGTKLEQSETSIQRNAQRAKVHAMDAQAIREHIAQIPAADETFWLAHSMMKEGKWDGEISGEDFSRHYDKGKGKDAKGTQQKREQPAQKHSNRKIERPPFNPDLSF